MKVSDIALVKRYAERIESLGYTVSDTAVGFIVKTKETDSHYPKEIGRFSVKDGEITKWPTDDLVPTNEERTAIEAELIEVKKANRLAHYKPMRWLGRDVSDLLPAEYRGATHYVYRDEKGEDILMIEIRIDKEDGKEFHFLTPMCDPDGDHEFVLNVEPPKFPIYGLELLKDVTDVYLFEGGKTTEAARRLAKPLGRTEEQYRDDNPIGVWLKERYADHAAIVGWTGGAKRVESTDWEPLNRNGLHITILEDADVPGRTAAIEIAKHLTDASVSRIQFDDRFPAGFDVADPFPKIAGLNVDDFYVPAGGWLTKEFPGSPGFRRALCPTWIAPVDPFEEITELGR